MKTRWFFIILFLLSLLVGSAYFFEFFHAHHIQLISITPRFVILLCLSVTLLMLAHYLRAYKSKFILDLIRESKVSTLFNGVSVGFLFNTLLPFRLGEFVRAYFVGDSLSISKTVVFISIIIERAVDGILLGASFIGIAFVVKGISYDAYTNMLRFGGGLLVVSIILLLIVSIIRSENKYMVRLVLIFSGLFNRRIADRMRFMAWSGIYGTKLMTSNRRVLLKFWVASVIMWLLYFLSTGAIVVAFFTGIDYDKLWFITGSSYAGVSIPSGPGYINTYHVIIANLTQKIGLGETATFSLLIWATITIPISLFGLFVLVRQRFGERKQTQTQEVLINKLYREKDVSPELSQFLDAYFKGERINQLLTQAELDGTFKLIKSFRGGSNAHTMLVWQNEELHVKKITLPQFAAKLKDQAEWLIQREHLKNIPRVTQQSMTDQYYSFDLAYEEDFFPFFDFIHSRTEAENYDVLQRTINFMNKKIYRPVPAKQGAENLRSYIEGKVLTKVSDTAALSGIISNLLAYPTLKVNGTSYTNLLGIITKIKDNPVIMEELSNYEESPIHGDLTIDNLIVSSEGDFMVIDPNNENQVSAPVVDFGKLYQSLHSGYEFLIQLEQCKVTKDAVDFEDSKSHKYEALFRSLDTSLKKEMTPAQYRSIMFHEAVHYCRMLPYRVNINPETVPVFYATAVKLFNEFYEQYQ